MNVAEWVITFDDGPLPSDIVDFAGRTEAEMLAPLDDTLHILDSHPAGPIPAVFFLRGPGYPWPLNPPFAEPPLEWFQHGIERMESAGHAVALHCYRHDPDLWWNWLLRGGEIEQDLAQGRQYFEDLLGRPLTALRPPYGQGGWVAQNWARAHGLKYHNWAVDTEDWLHHPDAGLLRAFENDPDGHLRYMLAWLPYRMAFAIWDPGPKDFLLHVSLRTAAHLVPILDRICAVTKAHGCAPKFVIPPGYA